VIVIKDMDKIKEAFKKVKSEMNDHLDAINENTNEINSNSEYMMQLEMMINKLNERIDDIEVKLSHLSGKKTMSSEDFKDIVLNTKEKEIFLYLYEVKGDLADYRKIARHLGYTEESIRKYIASLIDKGIPIIKKYFDNKVYLILDSDFRNLQAKENIIKLK